MRPIALPASFFGTVLGIVGLGASWRTASVLAPGAFVISIAAIAALVVGTLTRIVQGRLLPPRLTGEPTMREGPR